MAVIGSGEGIAPGEVRQRPAKHMLLDELPLKVLDNASEVGAHLLAGVQQFEIDLPHLVSNPRGRGMFVAFDLGDRETRNRVMWKMIDEGVLGLASGIRGIRFRPPLNWSREVADKGLSRVRKALNA